MRRLLLFIVFSAIFRVDLVKAQRKTWWAKKITDDFYAAGRLTDRQIKYAAESGKFKSIISIFHFASRVSRCNNTCEHYPSTPEAVTIARDAGIGYAVLSRDLLWSSMEAFAAFEKLVRTSPKPILVHGIVSFSATGLTLLYLAKTSQIGCADIYSRGLAHGFDYRVVPEFVATVRHVTKSLTCPTAVPGQPSWKLYWEAKRLTDCVYIAGQIQVDHVCAIQRDRFKTIANMRRGPVNRCDGDRPSQEQVTLLNINSYYYARSGMQRDSRENLRSFVLDPEKPVSYAPKSEGNFEVKNVCEFGDDGGYNETVEREFLGGRGIEYVHVPVGNCYQYDEDALVGHYCTLKELFGKCPILFHCRTGTRSAYFALLYLAISQGKSCSWAIEKGLGLGFNFRGYPMCRVISSFASGTRKLPACGNTVTTEPPTTSTTQIPTTELLITTQTPTSTNSMKCVFGKWSDWSECSESCDLGFQTRSRELISPCPANKKPELVLKRVCQNRPCNFDARVKSGRCKLVRVSNVTYNVGEVRQALNCRPAKNADLETTFRISSQVYCLKSADYKAGSCVSVKGKSKRIKIDCVDQKRVLFAINKKCK